MRKHIKTRLLTNKKRDSFILQVIDRNGDFQQYNFDTEAKALDFQRRLK
jgi:hypothetical protein